MPEPLSRVPPPGGARGFSGDDTPHHPPPHHLPGQPLSVACYFPEQFRRLQHVFTSVDYDTASLKFVTTFTAGYPQQGLTQYDIRYNLRPMSNHRVCAAEGCNRPVPDWRRFDAKYCSVKCSAREAQRRHRKKEGVAV